jgi:hypothetical protein
MRDLRLDAGGVNKPGIEGASVCWAGDASCCCIFRDDSVRDALLLYPAKDKKKKPTKH